MGASRRGHHCATDQLAAGCPSHGGHRASGAKHGKPLFFVAANRIGTERNFNYCGRSSICGPDGIELARASDSEEQMLIANVNLAHARNKRIERTPGAHVIDRFADRQPQFYGPVAD